MEAGPVTAVIADTSAWVCFFRGEKADILELALESGRVEVPSIVKLELLASPMSVQNRKRLEEALSSLPSIALDDEMARRAAELKASLESKGHLLNARDAFLLQCVLDRNALFLTTDPLFRSLQKTCNLRISM